MQLCSSLNILWHCLSLELECKLTFSSPVTTAEFSKFADILSATLKQQNLLGFEIAQLGEISITSDMQMTLPLWQKSKEELRSLLMKVKEESEENWLKTQHSGN